MPIKHKHQSALAPAGYDVDVNEWNAAHVLDGGVNNQALIRDTTNADGWKWGDVAALNSPVLTGTPAAPTAPAGTNTTQLATTAFVQTAIAPPTTPWTPIDVSGAGLTLTIGNALYVAMGKVVFVVFDVTFPTTANGSATKIGGLPFPVVGQCGGFVYYSDNPNAHHLLFNAGAGTDLFVMSSAHVAQVNSSFSAKILRGNGWYFRA